MIAQRVLDRERHDLVFKILCVECLLPSVFIFEVESSSRESQLQEEVVCERTSRWSACIRSRLVPIYELLSSAGSVNGTFTSTSHVTKFVDRSEQAKR